MVSNKITNQDYHHLAQTVIPGGVNSPVRSAGQVGGYPLYIDSAQGAMLKDCQGRDYVDYIHAYGPVILGHSDAGLQSVIQSTAATGWVHGQCHRAEIEYASLISELIPGIEQVRLMNSGTEAAMTAVRLARAVTQRASIIKFGGHYHGHADVLMPQVDLKPVVTNGIPSSVSALTHTLPFNDLKAAQDLFEALNGEVAAVLIEPIAGNMGMVFSDRDFLQGLRSLCDQYQCLLIFDEVMTGFRVGLTGAYGHYSIQPDLWVYGKIIGGGFPVGAVGGRRDLMQQLSPAGGVYQGGTFAANPMVVNAGLYTLKRLMEPGVFDQLNQYTGELTQGIEQLLALRGLAVQTVFLGGMFGIFFQDEPVKTQRDFQEKSIEIYQYFYHFLLNASVLWPPSAYEALFIGLSHNELTLAQTLSAIEKASKEYAGS